MIKIFLYLVSIMVSTFAISGININPIIKKGHIWEARFFQVIIILCLSYILGNFLYDLMNTSII